MRRVDVHDGPRGVSASLLTAATRPLGAGIALAIVLFAATFTMDPRGSLGTDTGGKVATLGVMVERSSWVPDLGYWAVEHDPEASLHPLFYTSVVGGHFVNVTTLPMILVARPLYGLGGYRLALALPIAGGIAAAFAGRAIAERVRPGRGWWAFWVVGLASPIAIYSLDLWEHTWGAALAAWGVVALMDFRFRPAIATGLISGACFGIATTMRTEVLAFGAVATTVAALWWWMTDRSLRRPFTMGLGSLVAVVTALAINAALEIAVMGEPFRAGRAAGTAAAGGTDVTLRVQEAVITGSGVVAQASTSALLMGIITVILLIWLASAPAEHPLATAVTAVVVAVYVLRIASGLGFVPGAAIAAPIAVVGAARGLRSHAARLPTLMALASLPVIWLFQFTGGALPQWGGRYLLPATVVLLAVGAAELGQLGSGRGRTFLALSVLITAFGLTWMHVRTHDVAATGERIVALEGTPLISDVSFWLRELGAFYEPERPWLTAEGLEQRERAIQVLEARGMDRFVLLEVDDGAPVSIDGYRQVTSETFDALAGVQFRLTEHERR